MARESRARKQAPPEEAMEPIAAVDREPTMHFGKFKGSPLAQVPEWYLEWCYGSFTKGRKRVGEEVRSRGYQSRDLERCRKQHPYLGKSPKKQGPKD